MRRLVKVSLLTSCLVILYAPVAQAQETSSIELSGGYSFLRDYGSDLNIPAAWYASVTKNLSDSVGVVGEVSGQYKSQGIPGTAATTLRTHTFLAGPRFVGEGTARVVPFVQMLFGGARVSSKVDTLGVIVSTSQTEFAVQPGAGVDMMFTERAGVRVQADYRRILADAGDVNEFRFVVGLVFGVGRR